MRIVSQISKEDKTLVPKIIYRMRTRQNYRFWGKLEEIVHEQIKQNICRWSQLKESIHKGINNE